MISIEGIYWIESFDIHIGTWLKIIRNLCRDFARWSCFSISASILCRDFSIYSIYIHTRASYRSIGGNRAPLHKEWWVLWRLEAVERDCGNYFSLPSYRRRAAVCVFSCSIFKIPLQKNNFFDIANCVPLCYTGLFSWNFFSHTFLPAIICVFWRICTWHMILGTYRLLSYSFCYWEGKQNNCGALDAVSGVYIY